jgi:eukaryotic-like serine/threonine-protein kinase
MSDVSKSHEAFPQPELSGEKHWFKGAVPLHLLRVVPRRLRLLAVLGALILLSGFVFFFQADEAFIEGFDSRIISIAAISYSVIISLAVFVLTCIRKIKVTTISSIGLVYEVLFALGLAVAHRMESWEAYSEFRGFSCVAVFLIIYAVLVPGGSMIRIAISAFITALMDPLGLMINVACGLPMPPLSIWISMFVPTILSVVVAIYISGIVFRLGQAVQRARQLGSYKLVELIGKGGMGEVWRAEHNMLARPAAIKLIRPEMLGSQATRNTAMVLQRFKQEAQSTALLDSAHTIHLYDYGATDDGSLYYVMELLDGMDLEKLVELNGPVCPERAVFFLLQICESLIEAHGRGLVHCDIKPANLFVCRKGDRFDFIKVLDFGLVKKATEAPYQEAQRADNESVRGTPAYLPPEIILGEKKPDARADIYALGCVAYWLISGQLVFERDSVEDMIEDHVDSEPIRLGTRTKMEVPITLEDIIHDCLHKNPNKRPQSIRELARQLSGVPLTEAWTAERAKAWWDKQLAGQKSLSPNSPTEVI